MEASSKGTIDSILEIVNRLHKIVVQDADDEGVMEEHTLGDKLPTSQSIGGLEARITGGTALRKTKSEPSRALLGPGNRIHKLEDALRRLRQNLNYTKGLQLQVEEEMEKQLALLMPVDKGVPSSENLRKILADWTNSDLEDITKKLLYLISKIPEKRKKKKASPGYQEGHGDDNGIRLLCLPAIHAKEDDLKRLAVFKQVKNKYEKLSTDCQICLLSFAVFPENRELNQTMLMYWWIGEGILPVVDAESAVKSILEDFMKKQLIEHVVNKRKVEPNCYKMSPFVHSSVVLISKEIGLFDMYQEEGKPTMKPSNLNKVCLVEGSSSQQDARGRIAHVDHIETVFNVSEGFPDFTSKWFSSMKKLKVLSLGRWDRTEREIIVDSRRVMKNLSSMRKLRFLSFQGILTINSLSRSVCKLTELIILDLRDCDYLEKLPEDIQKLKNLVYLDLSGCDALESIPMGLAGLSRVEVLKGFVVSDGREISCNLKDLKGLSKLRKLTVTIDREDFGLAELIVAIEDGFEKLEKLKVRWGSRISLSKKKLEERKSRSAHGSSEAVVKHCLPEQLKKLDLQRFPDSELPDWLQPQNRLYLEKLYLGSWTHLKGFGAFPKEPIGCYVKVLRLTCLPNLKVEWGELTQLYFPRVNFVECYECPRVTFSPCDRDGIWRSDDSTTTL